MLLMTIIRINLFVALCLFGYCLYLIYYVDND